MSVELAEAVEAAPALEVTTTSPAVVAPEVSVDPDAPPAAEKTFTQAELDAAVAKRLARAERKWKQELKPPVAQVAPVVPPKVEDYSDAPAYAEALAESKAQEIVNRQTAERNAAEVETAYRTREEAALDRYDDFEQVAYNPALQISPYMAETLKQSDLGPEVLYHLGMNPKEATRIAGLAPLAQAKEIGKIEAALATTPPVRKTSSAPAPITPVKASAASAKVIDTTDPRSTKSMSASEWIEADNKRVRAALEARRNR